MAEKAKRIVVKVGSSTVTDRSGRLDHASVKVLAEQIAGECERGTECMLVTSGAIAAGVERLGMSHRPREIDKLQAAAAVGQGLLIHEYTAHFRRHEIHVAQILLTQHDMAHRELYLNARQAISQLLSMGAVPIVNENDTTAVEEIKFGDNDTIAALVAALVEADLLILLSDTDGLYSGDPRTGGARHIERIEEITPEVEGMAAGIGTAFGSGGMVTKIHAARIAGAAQVGMYIADGRDPQVLRKIMSRENVGTYFVPKKNKLPERQVWSAFGQPVRGRITVDTGAAQALVTDGRSLLPNGVVGHSGEFGMGDTIEIAGPDNIVIAQGSTNYASDDLTRIESKNTEQIEGEIGSDFHDDVVHRNSMVVW